MDMAIKYSSHRLATQLNQVCQAFPLLADIQHTGYANDIAQYIPYPASLAPLWSNPLPAIGWYCAVLCQKQSFVNLYYTHALH